MRIFPLLSTIYLLLIIASCSKESETEPTPPYVPPSQIRITKIIDWEAANYNKDSVPEYTIEYSDTLITKLVGKYNDELSFKYEHLLAAEDAFGSRLRIIRTRDLFGGYGIAHDTARFIDDTQHQFTWVSLMNDVYSASPTYVSLQNPDNNNLFSFADRTSAPKPISVSKDDDGDIVLVEVFRDYTMEQLESKLEVVYNNTPNTLHLINRDLSFIDPSCRSAEGRVSIDLNANAFPFSIHYGTKCVSHYKVTSYNPITNIGYEFVKQVSYEFNDKGNIAKILIDDNLFKEFLYSQ